MIKGEVPQGALGEIQSSAYCALEMSRGARVDPLTAKTHTDSWLHELPVYVDAYIAKDNVYQAQKMLEFWLARTAPDGRVPHMIIDTTSMRRRLIDGPIVQKAKRIENGPMITPHSGPPVLSTVALAIAEAIPESKRESWVEGVLPKLEEVKRWQYRERGTYKDGLLVSHHPDETLFRYGRTNERILERLEEGKFSKTEKITRNNPLVQALANTYRRWQGDDGRGGDSAYNPSDYMSLKTASKLYDSTFAGKDDFRLQDVAVNALLIADNQAMQEIYSFTTNKSLPGDIFINIARTEHYFDKLYDPAVARFVSRIPDSHELLTQDTSPESLIALVGKRAMNSEQRAMTLLSLGKQLSGVEYPLSTGDKKNTTPSKIHRGAMHPLANFLIFKSLDSANIEEASLKLELGNAAVQGYLDSGDWSKYAARKFAEGYDSDTGKPVGKNYWGPTAASILVMARQLPDISK